MISVIEFDLFHVGFDQMHAKMSKILTELTEEKEMNKCLLANQSDWQAKVSTLEEQLGGKDKVSRLLP